MSIYLSHLTALRYWRSVGHPHVMGAGSSCLVARVLGTPQGTARLRRIPEGAPDTALAREVAARAFAGIDAPLDVLVARREDRRPASGIACHTLGGELPVGSFVKACDGVYVSSPALCLAQLAASRPEHEIALLAYEFCGVAGPSHAMKHGLFERAPLVTAAALQDYMRRAVGVFGCHKAARCLGYVLDRAASPMEAVLALKLHLPGRFGGYGFCAPLLNHRVELPFEARMHTGKRHFVYDLHWPRLRMAVEYDSDAIHALGSQRDSDSVRRATIMAMGERVMTVRTRQLFDTQLMEDVARGIALGMGIRRRDRAANVGTKREALHRNLLRPWLDDGSSPLFGRHAPICPQPAGWKAAQSTRRGFDEDEAARREGDARGDEWLASDDEP